MQARNPSTLGVHKYGFASCNCNRRKHHAHKDGHGDAAAFPVEPASDRHL